MAGLGSFWTGLKLVELDPATHKPKPGAHRVALAERPKPDAVEGAFVYPARRLVLPVRVVRFLLSRHEQQLLHRRLPVAEREGAVSRPRWQEDARWRRHGDPERRARPKRDAGKGRAIARCFRTAPRIISIYHAYDADKNGLPTLRIQPLRWTADGWPEAV
ncbi:MAG: hypothetical protein WDN06_07700 [Asticcacaulis sp.]